MIVKAFVLKQRSIGKIASLIGPGTIAVIRPQRTIEGLFREAIRKTIQEKKSAGEDLEARASGISEIVLRQLGLEENEVKVLFILSHKILNKLVTEKENEEAEGDIGF